MLDMFKLDGKVAIVTGASRGLGQGIIVGLAKAGADIVGVGQSDMSETRKLVESTGKKFVEVKADLTKQDKLDDIIQVCKKEFGRVDILVNNAGTIRREDAINYTEKDWDDILNLNLKTVFFLSKKLQKSLLNRKQVVKL